MMNDLDQANKIIEWYEKKYGPYIENRGLDNWRNLFRKPSMNDWIVLILLIMAIAMAFAYQHDISICQDYIKNQSVFIPLGPGGSLDITNKPLNISKLVIESGKG